MLLLATVTFITYANTMRNGFVWDDHEILVVRGGVPELPSLSKVFTGVDTVYQDERVPYYRPLHRYIHLLELRFFGLNPLLFHFVSILLHTVNVLLLFRLGMLLLGGIFPALVAALLFAVHPVNSEGVNFITSRQNMWALFFTISAALVYLQARNKQSIWKSFFAALLFLGGLFCKETALMPLVFLAIAILFFPSTTALSRWRSIMSLAPFALAIGIYAALRVAAIPLSTGLSGIVAKATLLERLGYNLYILPKYAFNLVFPVNLSAYYLVPGQNSFGNPTILTGLILITVFLFYLARQHSKLQILVLLWLAINWLPISNIIPIPSAAMADRYLYLPAVSLWFLAGFLAEQAHQRLNRNRIVPVAVTLAITTLSLLSMQRNQVWKNNISLFESITKAEPQAGIAGYNLGKALFAAGRIDEARREWERTIQIEPGHSAVLNSLGNIAMISSNLPLAEQYYQRSGLTNSDNAEAHYNLALIYEQNGRYREARSQLELFLRRVPPEYRDFIPEVLKKLEQMPQ